MRKNLLCFKIEIANAIDTTNHVESESFNICFSVVLLLPRPGILHLHKSWEPRFWHLRGQFKKKRLKSETTLSKGSLKVQETLLLTDDDDAHLGATLCACSVRGGVRIWFCRLVGSFILPSLFLPTESILEIVSA